MSRVIEKTFGGLVQSLFGSPSTTGHSGVSQGLLSLGEAGLKNVSFGLITFAEKLQAARKISKQEEEHCIERESKEWIRILSIPGVDGGVVADLMCRALIASCRGYSIPCLHIHAIKLTQSANLWQKRIGYVYVSRSLGPNSDLSLLMVNTVQRDLTSHNVLQVAVALSTVPSIACIELVPAVIDSITMALAHPYAYIRRRAAAVISFLAESFQDEVQTRLTYLLPRLQHLMMDPDPSVAVAATTTLARVYLLCEFDARLEIRDQVALSASHILTQARQGALPRDFNRGSFAAPFVQMQMLRAIGEVADPSWAVPLQVMASLKDVLENSSGSKDMGQYAILIECIFTVTALPNCSDLINLVRQVTLSFLKSSNTDLKYMGLKALANVFRVLQDALTPSHLEAVLYCLDHSDSNLQLKTLRLLCTMANKENYQAVCSTLLQFVHRAENENYLVLIHGELAEIIRLNCQDLSWCCNLILPLVLSLKVDMKLVNVLLLVVDRGSDENMKVQVMTEIVNKLLAARPVSELHMGLIATLINRLFLMDSVKDVVCKLFVDNFESMTVFQCGNNDTIFKCLCNISLHLDELRERVILAIKPRTKVNPGVKMGIKPVLMTEVNRKLDSQNMGQEVLMWLENPDLSRRVFFRQKGILTGHSRPDLSLSFLDGYVLEALTKGADPRRAIRSVSDRTVELTALEAVPETLAESFQLCEQVSLSSCSPSSSVRSIQSNVMTSMSVSRTSLPVSKQVWSIQGRCKDEDDMGADVTPDNHAQREGSVEVADEACEDLLGCGSNPSSSISFLNAENSQVKPSTDARAQLSKALLSSFFPSGKFT